MNTDLLRNRSKAVELYGKTNIWTTFRYSNLFKGNQSRALYIKRKKTTTTSNWKYKIGCFGLPHLKIMILRRIKLKRNTYVYFFFFLHPNFHHEPSLTTRTLVEADELNVCKIASRHLKSTLKAFNRITHHVPLQPLYTHSSLTPQPDIW